MTTPAIRTIRECFPQAQISILAKPWVAPVFENSTHVDTVLIYDGSGRHKGIWGRVRLARDLRKYHFEAAILLQNAFEAALITLLAGIPCRIGYNTDGRSFLLTRPVACKPEYKKDHQTRYYLNILRGVGLKEGSQDLFLKLDGKQRERAQGILFEYGISKQARIIGINPSATYGPAKQWPFERYARLADKIQDFVDSRVLIFGGPEDIQLGRRISQMMKHAPIDLSGKTELGEAMALIERCSLFITNDSGLMHVAAALNVPLIAIFGSTNATTTGPLSSNSRIVQVPMVCSPCLKPECPEGHLNCMDQIEVDMVFDVVKEML
ncbi:lipopolysaccharide heptosyltransferase II [Thermodesulfobacteriota bacterium]